MSVEVGVRRAFVLLLLAAYLALLIGAWPLVSRQDHLPAVPLAAILVTAGLLSVPVRGPLRAIVIGLPVAVELAFVVLNGSVRLGEAGNTVAFQADVLGLVRAGEPVMDPKGRRGLPPASDLLGARGRDEDTLAAWSARRRLRWQAGAGARARGGGEFQNLPVQTRWWVRAHYLRVARYPGVGGTLVAGARFDAVRGGFEVGIPALYVIVDRSGSARGLLDGRPYGSPRRLRPGFHSYRPAPGESPAAALSSNAAERGFSPFDAEGNWR